LRSNSSISWRIAASSFLSKTVIGGEITMVSTNTVEFFPVGDDKTEMVILETTTWFDGNSHVRGHRKGYETFFEEHQRILNAT